MARIKNWKRNKKKERSKLVAYAWRNTETGDTVSVDKMNDGWTAQYFETDANQTRVKGGGYIKQGATQSCARSAAVEWMRNHPYGPKESEKLTEIGKNRI